MATDLNRSASSLQLNPQYLAPILAAQASMRGLTEAAVLDRKGTMVARTGLVFALGFEDVSKDALRRAGQGEVVIMTDDQEERVRALVRLDEFSDLYLYVGRFIEPRVLAHRDETHLAAAQYSELEGQRSGERIDLNDDEAVALLTNAQSELAFAPLPSEARLMFSSLRVFPFDLDIGLGGTIS